MTIYTHNINKSLCEALGIEFHKIQSLSDQELDSKPDDATKSGIIGPAFPVMYGNDHPHYGKPRPDEVKAKISKSRSGQKLVPWTEERRRKTVASLKGRRPPESTMEALRKAHLGSKRSEEVKQKLREAQQKRRLREKGMI